MNAIKIHTALALTRAGSGFSMVSPAAKEVGVSIKTFADWERDLRSPSRGLKPQIARFLGYDPFTRLTQLKSTKWVEAARIYL